MSLLLNLLLANFINSVDSSKFMCYFHTHVTQPILLLSVFYLYTLSLFWKLVKLSEAFLLDWKAGVLWTVKKLSLFIDLKGTLATLEDYYIFRLR